MLFLMGGTIKLGANIVGLDKAERELAVKTLEAERERLEHLEKGKIIKLSEIMEPEVYNRRMMEKMLFVDEMMKESFKDLTDQVMEFEDYATDLYDVSRLKFLNNPTY